MQNPTSSENPDHVISYMELRKTLGVLGILLPFILMIGGSIAKKTFYIEPSISDYYATAMGDLFVGFLFAYALFLYTYRYERKDHIAGIIAGIFAAGVAIFPNSSPQHWIVIAHFVSAGIFLSVLAFFSLYLFRLTDPTCQPTDEKRIRNKVYLWCGIIMLACLVILGVYFVSGKDWSRQSFVYWMETVALIAFGISWLVKGEIVLKDPPHTTAQSMP